MDGRQLGNTDLKKKAIARGAIVNAKMHNNAISF